MFAILESDTTFFILTVFVNRDSHRMPKTTFTAVWALGSLVIGYHTVAGSLVVMLNSTHTILAFVTSFSLYFEWVTLDNNLQYAIRFHFI